ncbi:MAG: peptide chain release factor N(5)-glutamine methyltransferase [Xanthomonadales bacterium]|nr:peptide chain release factor N(5)-glutamine methyltransferase [Xanthomonadales bacterium]
MALSIKNLLVTAQHKLNGSSSARFDVEILMAHVLDSTRSFLYANPEFELPSRRRDHFVKLIKQRAQGEPIAYLTGNSEFWSLPLKVSPAVLIPRPETERLVEAALQKVPLKANWRIADLGTGSGAIALALASERKKCEILATDISNAAIKIARQNARELNITQVRFYQGSWTEPLKGQFHLIVSNPPYIDANDSHLGSGDLRYEPRQALTPGMDGLSAIREISQLVQPLLLDGGWLMFEHGWEQGSATRAILKDAGFSNIETLQDLAGHDRVTLGEWLLG